MLCLILQLSQLLFCFLELLLKLSQLVFVVAGLNVQLLLQMIDLGHESLPVGFARLFQLLVLLVQGFQPLAGFAL